MFRVREANECDSAVVIFFDREAIRLSNLRGKFPSAGFYS